MDSADLPRFLVGLTLRTCGSEPKEQMGMDEAETAFLAWTVVDTISAKMVAVHHSYVQPQEMGKVNWESIREQGIQESDLKSAPSLQEVLQQFEAFAATQLQVNQTPNSFRFVTDGQNQIRQVLYPEALKKGLSLPESYATFYDIRKVYRKMLNNNENLATLNDIVTLLAIARSTSENSLISECQELGSAIERALSESQQKGLGECFRDPDEVRLNLQHGICKCDDVIDTNTVVRARGLPWQSSDQDVARFFIGLNIAKGGVALCLSNQGRRNGEALVRFESAEQRDLALRRHRHFMGQRYIEIYRATGEDFIGVAAGNNNEAQQFLSRGAEVIIRMRGLPYDATPDQIIEFFKRGDEGVEVMDGEDGILFVNRADGRATGDAFVLLRSEEDAVKALAKHKDIIGTRYIELFRSTTAEVQQVINKSMEPAKADVGTPTSPAGLIGAIPAVAGLTAALPPTAILPQQLVISGNRKDCVRLRGLPYEAQVQHILDFLGEYAKHIVFQGVHMVYNAQGHPSGEAFIQMDSEAASAASAMDRHNKYMQIGKKQRYIEVFQCSADDMNLVLTGPTVGGGLPSGLIPNRLPMSPGGIIPGLQPTLASPTTPVTAANLFNAQQLLSPQLLGLGALQNGALAASMPGLMQTQARLPIIPGMMPAVSSPGAVVYPVWPYPSPPVSPSSYYNLAAQQQLQAQQQAAVNGPTAVLIRGLAFNASTTDILGFFQGYPDVTAECIQLMRTASGQPTGDAMITFPSRVEAERAVLEKNRQPLGQRSVELFLYSFS